MLPSNQAGIGVAAAEKKRAVARARGEQMAPSDVDARALIRIEVLRRRG